QISQDVTSSYPGQFQYTFGTTNYDNDFWDYSLGWPYTHAKYLKGPFTDASGKNYMYKFSPYAPTSHQNIPLWNGPGAGAAGILHPSDPYKVVLPNKWGGISWFAFGSPNAPAAHVGKLMDGTGGIPTITNYDFRLAVHGVCSPYGDAQYISAVVKREYEKRDRSLDLYSYLDEVVPPPGPGPSCDAAAVLTATDLKITERYGKTCADGCIPGGDLPAQATGKIESVVQVFTSTTGRRYGFNPYGKKTGPYGANDAALRVVHLGSTYNLDLNTTNIRNAPYITTNLGTTLNAVSRLGVSSNFTTPAVPVTSSPDYLYGSVADKFCIQDSWWGVGGLAFEYFIQNVTTPSGKNFLAKHIYRLDYTNSTNPTPDDVGIFDGDIDGMSVDGEGNLYLLTTELDVPNSPNWPDPVGLPVGPVFAPTWPNAAITSHVDYMSNNGWWRPGVGVPDYAIPSPSAAGDYLKVFFRQKVKKVCRKYTPSAGGGFSAGSVEDRGYVDGGTDTIARTLRYDGPGVYSWLNDWYHPAGIGSRTASLDAEFAVVNIAARPQAYNLSPTYSICRYNRVSPSAEELIEDTAYDFKLEGYKPFGANGLQQNFVYVGNLPNLGGGTYVNLIPPYENRDEDNNTVAGGMPSSAFETPSYQTTVLWNVELIDPTGAVVKRYQTDAAPNHPGADECNKYKVFRYAFPQPGRYRVWAKITYHTLNYSALAPGQRPSDFTGAHVVTYSNIETQKVTYTVKSNPNTAVGTNEISNIVMYPTSTMVVNQSVDAIAADNGRFNIREGASPASLSFEFDVQMARDANRDLGSSFSTFGGFGKWDYGEAGGHVYNYTAGSPDNNKFHPGYPLTANPAPANRGTRVDIDPTSMSAPALPSPSPSQYDLFCKDIGFITYQLYLTPPVAAMKLPANAYEIPIGTPGTCTVQLVPTNVGTRKYRVRVYIPSAQLASTLRIATPIDPNTYNVRLRLNWPRVKWYEHPASDAMKTYRSLQPDVDGTTSPGAPSFALNDYWIMRARDMTVLRPELDSSVVATITQTTGDPVPNAPIRFDVKDNNPCAVFSGFQVRYDVPTKQRDNAPATFNLNNAVPVKIFESDKPTNPNFYASAFEYKHTYDLTNVNEYGGGTSMFAPGSSYQNWIGTLSYGIEGDIQDGQGATAPLNITHQFRRNSADPFYRTDYRALVRLDNDPPSFFVQIISPSDNRRWDITLQEQVADTVCNPTTVGQLANTPIHIAMFQLDTGAVLTATQTLTTIPGSSNYPTDLSGSKDVDLSSIALPTGFLDALPRVRRSGRLLVNVDYADNVDYQPFQAVSVNIMERPAAGPERDLLTGAKPPLPTDADYDNNGTLTSVGNQAFRARYAVDMPMTVRPAQTAPANFQVYVRIGATDSSGSQRSLLIPIQVVDSSFDARVLESKENRR
ncbi:MAG TPA: hypothetical protein PKO06_06675, partial [Candidatus Ozemobacteraceae bacterium]|nr:hypothetical protein [Candidatus Ozemobacteraceae bacterium]